MKNTAAKFVSALFATVLAGSPLLAAPETEEKAEKEKPADTCLLGPSASVPTGGHWYYRYDRVNKRNCWYLGDAKGKSARKPVAEKQGAEEDSADSRRPAPSAPKKQAVQRSVTDARAEFQPQAAVEPAFKAANPPPPAAAPLDAQRGEEPRNAVTTRWPELAAAGPPTPVAAPPAQTQPQAAATPPQAAPVQPQIAQAPPQPQIQAQAASPSVPVAQPRPAVAPAAPAKASAAADQPLSLPMLLTVLVGGLSVIGVLVSAMFGRGKRGKKSRPGYRLSRSAPMPPLEQAETPRPQQPLPEAPQPELARAPDDPNRRLQQMLAEIQKRAAA